MELCPARHPSFADADINPCLDSSIFRPIFSWLSCWLLKLNTSPNHSLLSFFPPISALPGCSLLLFFFFKILFWGGGYRGTKRGREHQCVVASHVPPTGDQACNPGVCPNWKSNLQPFSSKAGAQSTEPHQPGLFLIFIKDPSFLTTSQALPWYLLSSTVIGSTRQ